MALLLTPTARPSQWTDCRKHVPKGLSLLIVANRLRIDRDLYGAPDDNTSFVEHRIPTYSEIMPVNDRFRRETGAGFRALVDPSLPPRRLPLTQVLHI